MIYDDNGGMLPKLYEDVLHTTTIQLFTKSRYLLNRGLLNRVWVYLGK